MSALTIIVDALVAGAAAAGKDTVVQGVKDGYAALKNLVLKRCKSNAKIQGALQKMEKKPESEMEKGPGSESRRVLREELERAGADKDSDLLSKAKELLEMLKGQGLLGDTSYRAIQTGNGGLAQGPGSTAAGKGGIAVGGNVQGNIVMGGERGRRGGGEPSDKEGEE